MSTVEAIQNNKQTPYLRVASATFSDDTTLTFSAGDVIVFVGPNNSGKSAALRNIHETLRRPSTECQVVKSINPDVFGSHDGVVESLRRMGQSHVDRNSNIIWRVGNSATSQSGIMSEWTRYTNSEKKADLSSIIDLFVCWLTGYTRLTAADPAPAISINTDPKVHPLHFLYEDEGLELRMSSDFRDAFNEDLVLNRQAGSTWPLHVGKAPDLKIQPGARALPHDYQRKIDALPTLQEQGDGMRAFMGVLLQASVLDYSTLLIDEPEAFLHPPQARLLGRMLVQRKKPDSQMFIATHSADVLRGLLDVGLDKVRVVRLRRDGDVNEVSQLTAEDVKALWSDPLLRHSNVLDGLFHQKVIVCEGDADCRFYEAVAIAVAEGKGQQPQDALFVHCGGQARLASLAKALRAVGVPVAVVADFDLLANEVNLGRLIEALGCDWSAIESDWNQTKTSIEKKKPELEVGDIKRNINLALDKVSENFLPPDARREITNILNGSKAWSPAKAHGTGFVSAGADRLACGRLLQECRSAGLFIVEVGELERFVPSVGGHGPSWVSAVLESKADLATDPELAGAREFVDAVLGVSPGDGASDSVSSVGG